MSPESILAIESKKSNNILCYNISIVFILEEDEVNPDSGDYEEDSSHKQHKHHHHDEDEEDEHPVHHQVKHHHHHDDKKSSPEPGAKPPADEFTRNYNFPSNYST